MPLFTRARTQRQQRHPASRSASHRKDKHEGEARRKTCFVAVAAPASVANFSRRYPETVPLDVRLARTLDAAADCLLGPELALHREAYARSVPEFERRNAAATLAALDEAREKLLQGIGLQRDSESEFLPAC